jgi:hypothetical protein
MEHTYESIGGTQIKISYRNHVSSFSVTYLQERPGWGAGWQVRGWRLWEAGSDLQTRLAYKRKTQA